MTDKFQWMNISKKHFVSQKIDNEKYFQEYSEILNEVTSKISSEVKNTEESVIFDLMGVELTEEEKEGLASELHPNNLAIPGEIDITKKSKEKLMHPWYKFPMDKESCDLKTSVVKRKFNYHTSMDPIISDSKVMEADAVADIQPYKHIIYEVRIYTSKHCKCKCSQVINLLGGNTLADLRDAILCPSDLDACIKLKSFRDIKDDPSSIKDKYPSGFFFINHQFFSDMRDPNSIDYTVNIKKWLETRTPVTKENGSIMTTISKLNVQLGNPYLYQHQGNCEHIVMFSSTRLLTPHDSLVFSDYPNNVYIKPYNVPACIMCHSPSQFIVTGAARLPDLYTHFCKQCLISYMYIDGKRVEKFNLYPVTDVRDCMK